MFPVSESDVRIGWRVVLTTGSLTEALLVQRLLQGYGLTGRIQAPAPYQVFPFSMAGTGWDWYRVLVLAEEWPEAQRIIDEHRCRYPWLRLVESEAKESTS
ncbi:MAG: hypothetical protein NZ742_06860 [Acidobacteria bacterium]|nr:hypothetical protein [Acidobacteriota bacterium]MDW7983702.1 hypothetical protein [Acidobacteriota bacterium]